MNKPKNITQSELARRVGVSRQALSAYMLGNRGASVPIADLLAELTDTDIRLWLKGGDPTQRQEAVQSWIEQNA